MKRVACVLLVMCMLCSTAFAQEILFRNIPWGTNIVDAEKEILNIPDVDVYYSDEYSMPYWENHGKFSLYGASSSYPTGYIMSVMSMGWISPEVLQPFKVGGHTVSYMDLYFRFGLTENGFSREREDSSLILAEYDFDLLDYESAYKDLKSKLTSLYGNGKESVEEGEGTAWNSAGEQEKFNITKWTTIWLGENGTAVKLEASVSGLPVEEDMFNHYMNLAYGKIDEKGNIDRIDAYVKQEELQAERNSISSDISGL